ncbi:MAG: hypothetical protein AAF514_20965, partial [Verrucomicrobiota bacterium]
TKLEAIARGTWRLSRVHMIPNGVDTLMFRPIEKEKARQRLGLDPEEFIVLFPAKPEDPNKNFEFLKKVTSGLPVRLLTFEGGGYQHNQIPRPDECGRSCHPHLSPGRLPQRDQGSPRL